jgi:hypothetical protein
LSKHAIYEGRELVETRLPRNPRRPRLRRAKPISRLTAALHIYGGDFFTQSRSAWDPETLLEQPYDVQKALRPFEGANARG